MALRGSPDPAIAKLQEEIESLQEEISQVDRGRRREKRKMEEINRDIITDLSDCKNKRNNWDKISTNRICILLEQLHAQTSSLERLTQYNTQVQGQLWNLVKQQSLNSFDQYSAIQKMMSQIDFFPVPYPQQNLELMSSINNLQRRPWFQNQSNQLNEQFNQLTGQMDAIIDINASGRYNPSMLIQSQEVFNNILSSQL